jgi:hypothetical protein
VDGQRDLRSDLGRRALPVQPPHQGPTNAVQFPRLSGDPHLEAVRSPVLPLGHGTRVRAPGREIRATPRAAAPLAPRSRSPHSPLMLVVFHERARTRREPG